MICGSDGAGGGFMLDSPELEIRPLLLVLTMLEVVGIEHGVWSSSGWDHGMGDLVDLSCVIGTWELLCGDWISSCALPVRGSKVWAHVLLGILRAGEL